MAEESKVPAPAVKVVAEAVVVEKEEKAVEKVLAEEGKVLECESFKEESNKVEDLVDPEKKALDELKLLIQEALNKREFYAPPPPPVTEEEVKAEEKEKEKEKVETSESQVEVPPPPPVSEMIEETAAVAVVAVVEKAEETTLPPETEVKEKVEAVEEVKEAVVEEVTAPVPTEELPSVAVAEEEKPKVEETAPPLPPEEVSIWGVNLLVDEKSDVILLKFLRARDFKVKEALAMLKSVVAWRKEFKIEELLEEQGIGEGLEKVVYLHGFDREGHPVCYNAFGEFQDKELYNNAFADAEKRAKFLRFFIQFLEKNIRKLDFTPEGISTIVQIIDLKNSPGLSLFKKELRQSTKQALQLLQDNYPEFVAKQIFINVPWWYVAYNRLISPFLTQRTKSKFVFAGPTRTTETLLKYIAPEQLPAQYGGLNKNGEQELTPADSATEEIIKPTSKHTIELPITEVGGTLDWEVRVIGWDISYGAEFVPNAKGSYTWIVQKPRKIGPTDEQLIGYTFKITEPGKVVLTFDNQTSKKKKLLYRFKTKPSECT